MKRWDFIGVLFILFIVWFCAFGIPRIQSNTEDVLQWLPDQSPARAKYDYFEQRFGSDDFLVVTWKDCTIDDPRLRSFAAEVRANDKTGLIQRLTTGQEVATFLNRELKISQSAISKRLKGIFFGYHDPNLTCALIELSRLGTADRAQSMEVVWDAILAQEDLNPKDVTLGGYPHIATYIDRQLSGSFRNFLLPSVILATLISLICLFGFANLAEKKPK